MDMYLAAWPQFLALPAPGDGAGGDDDARPTEHVQRLLTGSVDTWAPPVRCLEFFHSAARAADLPPGLRFFFIIAATLARAAEREGVLGNGDDAHDVDDTFSIEALCTEYLRVDAVMETLGMPEPLRRLIVERIWHAQVQCQGEASRETVNTLTGAVMMACARLLWPTTPLPPQAPMHPPAAPLALLSQLGVGHVIAEHTASRRIVVGGSCWM